MKDSYWRTLFDKLRMRMKEPSKQFDCWDGYTVAVVFPKGLFTYRFLPIGETKVKCERQNTGLRIPEHPSETGT